MSHDCTVGQTRAGSWWTACTHPERALIRADRYDLWATIRPGDVGGTGRNQHTKAA